MKKFRYGIFLLAGILYFSTASANDSGVYTVIPFNAKYHTDSKLFSFTGQFAITLKQLLPPHMSVLTNTNPEIKSKYEKNFRALFVQDGSGRGVMFNCSSADLNFSDGGKPSIVEKPETSCSVGILSSQDSQEIPQDKIPVKDALQKATQANQLK